jgi:hypothetical protein
VVTARELVRTAVVSADPDTVWALIGDFHGLGSWHPYVPPSTADEDGAVRVFSVEGRVVARERLLSRDDAGRSYTYTVLDPMLPISDYVATLAVRPHADGGSEVVWRADYRSDDAAVPQVESVFGDGTYGTGLAALRERFGSPGEAPR